MPGFQSPELVALFEAYTSGPASLGATLTRARVDAGADDPLLVATGTDMAIFPGSGAAPLVESFRLSTRGFKELAGVSHLGPAMASLVNLRALDLMRDRRQSLGLTSDRQRSLEPTSDRWRVEAERLLRATETARAANSPALWRERIAVAAYRGREDAIAALVDYACALSSRYLRAVLADETLLTPEFLQREYLEAQGDAIGASVPFNAVMIATFFLTGLDIAHRIMRWLRSQRLDWTRLMVLICGQQGRPTSGVTWTSNSICQIILGASDMQLPLERMYIAPHAPSFAVADPQDLAAVSALEPRLRSVWFYTRAISELAPTMFSGYPRYAPEAYEAPRLRPETTVLADMPRIGGPDDMRTLTTRLRLVMEDPRQLLSGCVTDYAVEQLRANGNDPSAVVVPGLDGYRYPVGT